MQKLIILTEQSLNDDNRGYYYNSLDINCPKIQKYLNNEIFINEYKDINLFSSPYLSCLELSTELIKLGISNKINVDNALYDVLSKNKYDIHNSNYYLKSHFFDDAYSNISRIKKVEEKNILKQKNNSKLKQYINTYYNSSIMASNIKYNENDMDINKRISPFLYNLFRKQHNVNIIITHDTLINNIQKYINYYNKLNIDEINIELEIL